MSLSGIASVFSVWDETGDRFSCSIDESGLSVLIYGPMHPDRESPPPYVAWAHFRTDELGNGGNRVRLRLMEIAWPGE
jgi:hypothetical protein